MCRNFGGVCVKNKKDEMLGRKFLTNKSGECTVVEYINAKNVLVEFKHPPYIAKCSTSDLKRGEVKNPLYPSFYGRGFVGVGEYSFKDKAVFSVWKSMILRTCDKKFKEFRDSYKHVEVCKEWLNFQNFAAWCYDQKFFKCKDDNGFSYCLDKDILIKGSKVYSPETCCFVPQDINKILCSRRKLRGEFPVGVSFHKQLGKFKAAINHYGKSKHLGVYKTPEQAFNAYKAAKESHIKEMAKEWKDRIDERVYQALLSYEVHIDD